jgi:CheY-like chemotaxis protein
LPFKILIAEDDADARQMIKTFLEIEGYHVICAEDGRQGYEMALQEQPNLILTDIAMPDMSGIEMIEMLRRESTCREIPIIAMTSYRGELMNDALRAGADKAINKPLDIDSLLNLLKQRL